MILAALVLVAEPVPTPSAAVQLIYRQACVFGELRLDRSNAVVVQNGPLPSIISPPWGIKAEKVTVLRIKYPPWTYVLIAEYKASRPQHIASVCRVFSQSISYEDAERVFLADVKDPKVWRDLNPARAYTPYEIDRPKEGFRKRLQYRDPWVILETAMYKEQH